MGGVKSITPPDRNKQLILTNVLLNVSINNGKKLFFKNALKEIFELIHSKQRGYWYVEKQIVTFVAVHCVQ
jgi:hypothetical protein